MKKTFITILTIGTLLSCKKSELELGPFNQIETAKAFNTQTDVSLAINGMYAGMRGAYVNSTWNILGDALADNVILSTFGRQTLVNFSEWRYNGNATSTFITTGYSVIRRANAILENIDKFPVGAFKDNARGEALAVRALLHFDIARLYAKTFTNATNTDSVAPYIVSTAATQLPSKEPVRGFYNKIVADLVAAEPLIAVNNGTGKLNRAAVNGLLSRVYLYMGDYARAITAANQALGTNPVLPSLADFARVWTDETSNGVLFKVLNTSQDDINTPGVNYYQITSGNIRSEYVAEYNLRQAFSATDVRTTAYIVTSPYNGVQQNHVIKYRGRIGGNLGVLDVKILRTAEVLLNRAESNARLGNETAALADLNLLGAQRYANYQPITNLSGAALITEILKERRLELAFEGDRFFDLKRLNLPINRDGTRGDRADGTGTTYLFLNMAANDHRFQLPYPNSEINFNINFKQNPGY
ncbi:MAG: RagB/SusD family nutrient uptake outer membrane protein [Chitinophagaceae bacterium]|nr:RagB/SusD family nutrient uptake outer membrane protein [Chitinophagaceae bacterium]